MPLPFGYQSVRSFRGKSGNQVTPSALLKQTWTDPIAADDNGFSVSHAGKGSAGSQNMTLGGALCSGGVGTNAHPRNVVITVTHATSVVAMSGVISGTDIHDNAITEAWSVTATGTSKTFTGKKAFKTVTQITEVVAADASANSIIAGSGVAMGFSAPCAVASAVKEIAAGSVVTNGTVVAASAASTDDSRGTYTPNTAQDGANDYTVYYISDSPENDN